MNLTVIGSAGAVSPEERALHDLYLAHGPSLYAYVVRLVGGDCHRAEDIVQETLLRCWKNRANWQPRQLAGATGTSQRPWLFRVARNLVIDGHRMRRARPLEVDGSTWLGESSVVVGENDHVERILSAMVLREALLELTPAHREVLEATYFADRTTQQAADVLGIPHGTVKSRVYYALRSLKLALQERGIAMGDGPPPSLPPTPKTDGPPDEPVEGPAGRDSR
ncbi:RNA polymerase, sigma-24 subunit, RpoE, ECF subfamily [Actinobacteria bacterium OK074]|nr:RNA polymerase, sigma-24 subunit, RpoE, ECF subfamily [Actinobacteria bacterium OK074]